MNSTQSSLAANSAALRLHLEQESETIRLGYALGRALHAIETPTPTSPLPGSHGAASLLAPATIINPSCTPRCKVRPAVQFFLLYGDLGSGKTTLTRGFVSALAGGEEAEVSSPSFTLCNMYPTRPALVHCDLYRLSEESATLPEEAEDALEQGGLVLVEWAERLSSQYLPLERLDIMLQSCKEKRSATLLPHGQTACRLLQELARSWSYPDSHVTAKD